MWNRATPGRLAREEGTIIKDWGGRLPVALVYPNSYYLGMSNLGIQAIYRLLNRQANIVCERVFWEKGQSPLSVESGRPLNDFAVLAFSVSYELDYFNVVQVLRASGIPLYAAQRDERHPLVIAGGPCVTANPMPLSPFFDCLGIGEAEAILPAMLPVLVEGIGGRRDELLKALAQLPGLYVPGHSSAPVARQWAKDLDGFPVTSVVLTRDTELGDLYLVEVERGCGWGCRFCLVCNTFSPMRCRSAEKLVELARQGLNFRKRIGLVGPAVTDHPEIEEILARLRALGAELSVSSMRMGSLTPGLLGALAKGGLSTIALAPEAGSPRLRQVIRKGITEADILDSISMAAEQGMKQLKLYFMIGLPTETDEDIRAIIDLTLTAKAGLERRQSGTRLTLNISPFVPKAGTPFQWLGMAPVATLSRRLETIKRTLAPRGIRPKCESPAWSEVQAVLARGDARVAQVLAGMKELSLPAWRKAAKEHNLDIDFYAHQKWDVAQGLPWAVIDSGAKLERLKGELDKALAEG